MTKKKVINNLKLSSVVPLARKRASRKRRGLEQPHGRVSGTKGP